MKPKETVKMRTKKILQKYPDTRNDDRVLAQMYWREYFGIVGDSIRFVDLWTVTSHKDIARERAVIQNVDRELLPTDWTVAKKRKWAEDEWRDRLGYPRKVPTGQSRLI